MVWGLILESKSQYSQHVFVPFEITGAALDITQDDYQPVKVMMQFNDINYLLCTLQKNLIHQAPLNINIRKGCVVKFFIIGKSSVHLTGNFRPEYRQKDNIYYLDRLQRYKRRPYQFIRDAVRSSQRSEDSSKSSDDEDFIKQNKVLLDELIKRITHRM
ncbi:46 kDa FK506-binding nuclear protein-like isoform X1 [Pseudomyrmex gracilis]|uniref:46 kDa FK506-binding nuclear protein-like isoform X1 n=1 Tax=Pseudomyrmex gracilis TaxID=219809 RepID=UPI000994A822|nr:46 kDa FK506-binding nuclear protein-like isoform X1 [Pseudomyrmex gracilis]